MKIIKENKVIILFVVILGLAFYWFQVRPIQIRKGCFIKHLATAPDLSYESYLKQKNNPENTKTEPYGKKAYEGCLLQHGLNN